MTMTMIPSATAAAHLKETARVQMESLTAPQWKWDPFVTHENTRGLAKALQFRKLIPRTDGRHDEKAFLKL